MAEKQQLISLHQQRVQAELNEKKRHAMEHYMDILTDDAADVSWGCSCVHWNPLIRTTHRHVAYHVAYCSLLKKKTVGFYLIVTTFSVSFAPSSGNNHMWEDEKSNWKCPVNLVECKFVLSLWPFEAALLIEAAVGLEGHSLVECVCIKLQQSI